MLLGAREGNCSGKVMKHFMSQVSTLHGVSVRPGLLTSEAKARVWLDLRGAHEQRPHCKGKHTIKLQNKE